MDGARGWTIFYGLVIVVASQVAGDYDGRGSEIVEGPRVERMHSETADGCVGSNCLAQSSEGAIGAMWFGPRLGRRRRSGIKYFGKEIERLGEALGLPGFTFITVPDGEDSRQEIAFTPREGHELGDTLFMRNLLQRLLNQIEEQLFGEQEEKTSLPVFSSRLSNTRITPRVEQSFRSLMRKFQAQES